jgi:hypothetical protein
MSGKNQHGPIMFTGSPDWKSDDLFGNYLQLYFSCFNTATISPRFLCRRPTTLYIIARAVERQSAIYTENSGFSSPTLGQHISTFRGYGILFSIRNPYINCNSLNLLLKSLPINIINCIKFYVNCSALTGTYDWQ